MIIFCLICFFFGKAKNDFINDFTTLRKPLLQFDTGVTTLHKKKVHYAYPEKKICMLDNRNIQITVADREKNGAGGEGGGGIDSIETTFDFFPFMEFYFIPHKCYSTFYIVYRSDFCF